MAASPASAQRPLSPAEAQRAATPATPDNLVVEAFSGISATNTRNFLVQGLGDHPLFRMVDHQSVRQRGRELFDATRLSAEQYVQLARELDIRAFLSGRIAQRGGRYVLTVTVRSGETGEVVGQAEWRVARPSGFSVLELEAYAQLTAPLELTRSPARVPAPVVEEPPPEPPVDLVDEVPPPVDPDVVAADDDPRRTYEMRRMDAFRVELLVSTLRRNLDATAEVDPAQRGGTRGDAPIIEERGFSSTGLGGLELGFRLELYPGALLTNQERYGFLGFYLAYRSSAGLSTTFDACTGSARCTDEDGLVSLRTRTTDVDMGVRIRHRFGKWRHSPTIMADIGYGLFRYDFDADGLSTVRADQILPPMRYRQVHLGTGLEVGIVPIYLSFVGRFHYRLGTQIGDDALAIWGQQTYDIRGMRILGELRTEMPYIVPGMYLGLGVEYFRFRTVFRGQAGCAVPGADGSCPDDALWERWPTQSGGSGRTESVTGGLRDAVQDSYFRITLTLGYAFR